MHVTSSGTIQSPAELIVDTRGIETLILNKELCPPPVVHRLAQLLRPFTTIEAVERELAMKKYSYNQTAALLDTSVKWLQRRVRLNKIPHGTDGHRTWFELHDILAIRDALRAGELDSLDGGRHAPRQTESDQ